MGHGSNQIDPMDFRDALRTVRNAKCWLLVFLSLALAVQITAFVLVDMGGLLDAEAAEAEPEAAVEAAADLEAAAPADEAGVVETVDDDDVVADEAVAEVVADEESGDEEAVDSDHTRDVLMWTLGGTKFLCVVFGLLLVLTVLFSVKLSLVGRVGAPSGFLSAFYWSLILLVVLIPWQTVLAPTAACGATFSLGDLLAQHADVKGDDIDLKSDFLALSFYYARFMAYPALALLMVVLVGLQFANGYRPLKRGSAGVAAAPPAPAPPAPAPYEPLEP